MEKLKVFGYSGGSIFDPDNEMLGIVDLDEGGKPFVDPYGAEPIYLDRDALLAAMEEEKIEALKNYIKWALSLSPLCGSAEWTAKSDALGDEIDRHAREIWEFVEKEVMR